MLTDKFGGRHSSANGSAVAAYEEAVLGIVSHRPTVTPALQLALATDPGFTAAHSLKGLAAVILARAELRESARSALAEAEAARAAHGGCTASEATLITALAEAVDGRLSAAADLVDRHVAMQPWGLLAIKLSHALRFMLGDSAGMLATTLSVLPAWDASMPGYGFLQGCHAFGLEENGQLQAAERAGHTALAHEPMDAWALHAVSHVHETLGRTEQGVSWLEGARPVWTRCNNLSFHMAWHLALLYVEQERDGGALAIYDAEVRPQPTDDFRDMANAVSLLWRLRQEGVEVGRRWDELRQIARRRRQDTTLMFASLHYLMALVATGETAAAHELVAAIAARAVSGQGDQARVAARVGLGLAKAILGIADRRSGRMALDQLARATPQLGGSHIQRDVFIRTLALLAADQGDRAAVARIVAQRSLMARENRFATQLQARLDAAAALPRAS
jgi:hypothetical protein